MATAKWMGGLVLLILTGCAAREESGGRPWRDYVLDLTEPGRLGQLEQPGTRLISSYDATGGNDDFNRFQAPGSEPGWVTLADVKGPGVVRRFWTTGVDTGHPFKVYFDGEKKPRLSGTVDELFGDRFPFQAPLARYLNLCWFSYLPLTFQKSIRIESKAPPTHPFWGPRRLFFQLNVETCPAGQSVQTFPREWSPDDRAALEKVQAAWWQSVEWPRTTWDGIPPVAVTPGAEQTIFQHNSAGLLSEWWLNLQPADPSGWTQREREKLLQDVVLRIRYDGMSQPSVEVPLGDFFGNAWRTRHYGSLLIGSGPEGYRCAFPLPFKKSCTISVVNGAKRAIQVLLRADVKPLPVGEPAYFHAEWRRSGPASGVPHTVLDVRGRGHFAGCFLGITGQGVTQQDNSWWLLEGDEQMWVDGETRPSWHGTGLEDYFNGGWYYRQAAFSALHGILDRAPFQVAQYRHQLVDPVTFQKSLRITWERGDQNVSHAWFQSTAYFYADQPLAVNPVPADRAALDNRYFRQTLMLQLTELERMNNFQQAINLIAEYRERYPEAEENHLYALRALEYRRLLGEKVSDEDYAPFLNGERGPAAAEQAKLLTWFHAAPNRALLGLNANAQARMYLDGQQVLSGDHPFQLFVTGVELGDGPHVLAADATMTRQDPWIQMAVRTHSGLVGTGLDTQRSRQPSPGWNTVEAGDVKWNTVFQGDLLRGTPDAPMIGSMPNAFVLLGSKAYSIRGEDWSYYKGAAYFRQPFQTPLQGWPAQARRLTGLKE